MKRNLAVGLLMVTVLVGAAAAVGGSGNDPLISLRYLEDTYLPQTVKKLQERAAAETKKTYAAAASKLEQLVADALADAGGGQTDDGMSHSADLITIHVKREDSIDLTPGSCVILKTGRSHLAAGGLVDVTGGIDCKAGAALVVGHRYLVTGDGVATLATISDRASVSLQGGYRQRISSVIATPFTDIGAVDWFYAPVRYCYQGGLFQGTAPDLFQPQGSVTRGMLATVLYRLAGEPPAEGSHHFNDVPQKTWYTDPVTWAAGHGIVHGMTDTSFAPDNAVTREQMAAMLYRYAGEYLKQDVGKTASLDTFSDGNRVSPWATGAMSWAVGTKVVSGRTDGTLDASGNATRAEVAAMLQRFSVLISVG